MAIPTGWHPTGLQYESGQAWINQVQRRGDARLYALKRLKNPKRSNRFRREVAAMKTLNQRGVTAIPEVIDADLEAETPWFVMSWFHGGSLEEAVADRRFVHDPIAGVSLLIKLAAAIRAVHEGGFAHRDLKPANVLLDGDEVLLGDFGLCLQVDAFAERDTETHEAVGSRLYVAPENERGINEELDQRPADFYAFGKVLWAVLAGEPPPAREDQLETRNRLDEVLGDARYDALRLVQVVLLKIRPQDRLASWDAVIRDLETARARFERNADSPAATTEGLLRGVRRLARQTRFRESIELLEAQSTADQVFQQTVVHGLTEGCNEARPVLDELTEQSEGVLSFEVAGVGEPKLDALVSRYPELADALPPGFDPEAATGLGRPGPVLAYQVRSLIGGSNERASLFFFSSIQPEGLWLVSVPVVARGGEMRVPVGLLGVTLRSSGPITLGLQQTTEAAREFAAAGFDRFQVLMARFLDVMGEGLNVLDDAVWREVPIAETTAWQHLALLRMPRAHHAGLNLDDQMYLLAGQVYGDAVASVEAIGSDSIPAIPDLPEPRLQFAACVDQEGDSYVFGGVVDQQHDDSLLLLRRGAGGWVPGASMNHARSDFAGVFAGEHLYAVGGLGNGVPDDVHQTVERYSITDDCWDEFAVLLVARRGCAAAVVGSRLFVAGGATTGAMVLTDEFEIIDLRSATRESGPPLPTPRAWCSGLAIQGAFYVIGGHDRSDSNGYHRTVEKFDPATGRWSKVDPLRVARGSFSSFAMDYGRIVVAGGDVEGSVTTSVEQLTL